MTEFSVPAWNPDYLAKPIDLDRLYSLQRAGVDAENGADVGCREFKVSLA